MHSVLPTKTVDVQGVHALSARYEKSLRQNDSWADINYSNPAWAKWANAEHRQRLLVMAKSARLFRDAGNADAVLDGKTLAALKFWLEEDFKNPNWWWNEIGVPELLGEITSLMLPEASKETIKQVANIMLRSNWKKSRWTGANLTWGVVIQIVRGCLETDPAVVAEGYSRMYQEIRYVAPSEEGIQQDASFHQHGAQLYNGGYGLAYANDVGRFVSFAWGTQFQIPSDRMEMFSSYILDGEQWIAKGDVIDYSTVGREITRAGKVVVPRDWTIGPISPAGPAYSLHNVVALLAKERAPRQKEFQTFAERLEGQQDTPGFMGNKQFWCSDFMAHRRAGFYTSVKMLSDRMINGEQVNGEGKKSHHLSDGVNFLYLTGDEYKDIFPAWDWTKLPGSTAIQGTSKTGENNPMGVRGKSVFTGGVSEGTYGMAAMDLLRGDLSAKKAWFFFDDNYVALGAGITLSVDKEHDVATDINQPLLIGNVYTNLSSSPVPTGQHDYGNEHLSWVYHDRVGYIIDRDSHVILSVGKQTGSWADIGGGSTDEISLPVFNLWVDHGKAPNDQTYQYIVFQTLLSRR